MDPHLDLSLGESVKNYLDTFLTSLQGDNTVLKLSSFLSTLSTLNTTVRAHHGSLRKDTLIATHNFASLINSMATNILELENASDAIGNDLGSDVSRILDEKMENLTINDSENSRHLGSRLSPAYLKPSYQWLLQNLHNPYPSKDMRRNIARESKCSLKDIDAWFSDTRKRIGWNSLRKSRFANKQEKIIAAATQFFKPVPTFFKDDLDRSLHSELDPDEIYRHDFVIIQKTARSLYADRFPDLVNSIHFDYSPDCAIPPVMSKLDAEKIDHERHDLQQWAVASDAYPTPEPSPPSYTEEPSPLRTATVLSVPQSTSRKRCKSWDESSDNESNGARPFKRIRHDKNEAKRHAIAASSLSPNVSELLDVTEQRSLGQHNPEEASSHPGSSSLKRKRRLSDCEGQSLPKRPHNALCLPRLQTVSDPLPVAGPFLGEVSVEWLQDNSTSEHQLTDTIPAPANGEGPASLLTPLEVELYQYDFSPYNLGADLPTTFPTNDLGNVESAAAHSPSNPSENFLDYDRISFTDALQGSGFGFVDTANIQFGLDFPPSYQLDFRCDQLNASDAFPIFQNSELLSLTYGHMPDALSFTGDAYSNPEKVDSASGAFIKMPVLGNVNHTTPRSLSVSQEQEMKRARAQALREELALYEAEGL